MTTTYLFSPRASRASRLALLLALILVLPAVSYAQDFGVAESAETIDRGTFKIKANPMLLFGGDNLDNDVGITLMGGYGFTDSFDVEGGVAFYDGVTFFGANAEYWAVRNRPVNVSVAGGLHFGQGEGPIDTTGVDLTFIGSGTAAPRLEIFGALDFAFESFDDDFVDDGFTTVHIIPGIEYRLNDDLDFVAELGIGVTDESSNYVTAGLAYYFRE
jgi:hypothetical protein